MNNVYTLKTPLETPDERITALSFRPLRTGDLRFMRLRNGRVDFANLLDLAARLSGQPPSLIDRLELEDGLEVMDLIGRLLRESSVAEKTQ